MANTIEIIVENRFFGEKRDLTIYHHSTRTTHVVSYGHSVNLSLRSPAKYDYLHISVVCGPGNLEKNSVVELPSWLDFELFSVKDTAVTRSGNRTCLKIPSGFPTWQVKLTGADKMCRLICSGRITVGEDGGSCEQ